MPEIVKSRPVHVQPGSPARPRNVPLSPQSRSPNRVSASSPQTPPSPSAAAPEPAPVRAAVAEWCAESGVKLRTVGAKIMSTGLGAVVGFVGGVAVTATNSADSPWIAGGLGVGIVVGYSVPWVLSKCCFGISDALAPARPSSPPASATVSPPGSPGRPIPQEIA